MPVSMMLVYKLSRELERISEDSEHTKFDVPFFYWSLLKTGFKWECWTYVLKDHMNETENETINLQTDLLMKTR